MNPQLILNNLLAYSLQVGILIAIAGCLPAALRLRQPGARLFFWRCALAACLTLPLVRPWRSDVIGSSVQFTTGPVTLVAAQTVPHSAPIPWTEIALAAIALGVLFRLALLGAGFWRLGRYRRRSQPFGGVRYWDNVSVRISHEIEGPVTFGFFRPVILLPERFPTLAAATRDAILHHEMLHVARHDWLDTVAEELVRAALWFHPAVWWLLGEMQLTREQAVDREVIAATNATDQYIDALLTIARAESGFDLAPAFLRRRQLKQRVVSILQEARMPERKISRTKAISTAALAATLMAGACWLVTSAFPLRAQSHVVYDDIGVSVDTFGAALQHRTSVFYPGAARDKKIEGTVIAQVRLGDTGTVTDAQIVSGPDELRNSVLHAVLDWHFARDLGGTSRQVAVTFKLTGTLAPGSYTFTTPNGPVSISRTIPLEGAPTITRKSSAAPAFNLEPPAVRSIRYDQTGLTPEQVASLPVHLEDKVTPESLAQLQTALRALDEHYIVRVAHVPPNGLALTVAVAQPNSPALTSTAGLMGGLLVPVPPPPAGTVDSGNPEGPLVVGGRVQSAKLDYHVDPVYPVIAKTARISGKVILSVIIGPDGAVQNLVVVSGHPMLQQAALQAVRQWIYKPTLLNGQPVAVQTTVEVNFTLSQ